MRALMPFLPALLVGLAAIAVVRGPESKSPLAVVETPVAHLRLAAGQHLDFDLGMRVLKQPPRVGPCPTLFLHLLDGEGRVVRGLDHRVESWLAPVEAPGKRIVDRSTLAQSLLEEPLPAGTYQLMAGLWEPDTRRRFRLRREDSRPAKRLPIAEVELTDAPPTAPKVDFAGDWSAPEPTDSVHGRVRRAWTRASTIRIGEHPASLEWRLVIDLPPWATPRADLEVDCTGEKIRLLERWQEIRLRLPAGESCGLRFPPIDSTGDTGGLLYALSWAERPNDATEPSCVRALK